MSSSTPPRIAKAILPQEYYGMYDAGNAEIEKPRRGTWSFLRFFLPNTRV